MRSFPRLVLASLVILGRFLLFPAMAAIPDPNVYSSGFIAVPEDYSHPDGKTIEIYWERLCCASEPREALVLINGGPGFDHQGFHVPLPDGSFKEPFRELANEYEIFLYDQRGNGKSSPLNDQPAVQGFTNCRKNLLLLEDAAQNWKDGHPGPELPSLLDLVTGTDSLQGTLPVCPQSGTYQLEKDLRVRCSLHNTLGLPSFASGTGPLFEFYSTENNARDIEELRRQVIKREKIAVLGESYGGCVAMTYALAFPESLSALVVHSAPPSYDYYTNSAGNLSDNLSLVEKAKFPGMQERFERVLERFASGTIQFPEGSPGMSADDFVSYASLLLYSPPGQAALDRMVKDLAASGTSIILDHLLGLKPDILQPSLTMYSINVSEVQDEEVIHENLVNGPKYPIFSHQFIDRAVYENRRQMMKPFGHLDFRRFDLIDRLSSIKAPTLIFVGEFDPTCPPKYGRMMKELMGEKAELVLLPGCGHGGFQERPDLVMPKVREFVSGAAKRGFGRAKMTAPGSLPHSLESSFSREEIRSLLDQGRRARPW